MPVSAFVTLFAQPVPVDPQGSGLEPVNALQQSLSLYLFVRLLHTDTQTNTHIIHTIHPTAHTHTLEVRTQRSHAVR